MKIKKLLVAGIILLAVLTIGAACASDNATDDALSADEEVLLEDSNAPDEVLNDGTYYDDDFYVSIKENYTQDKSDLTYNELIYIYSTTDKNGTFKVLVDDVEKDSIPLTNGYFYQEYDNESNLYNIYYLNIYPTDLGIDCGNYNIKLNFIDNSSGAVKNLIDNDVSITNKDDFDIWMQNPYYCEEEYWTTPSFMIIDSNQLNTGLLEIYVNGTRKLSYTLTNGSFEYVEGSGNRSRFISASDLFAGYGQYNVAVNFTENGVTKSLRDEDVLIAEYPPTTDPRLDLYFDIYDLYLPADDYVNIYLPREANGTLTINYNNVKDAVIPYSKGFARFLLEAYNLNHLGENKITVTYTGDDFGTLTATGTVIVNPNITAPTYVKLGEEFTITMITHGWVNGYFKVYEYNNGVKGKLLASNRINQYSWGYWAKCSVELSSNTAGSNMLYLEFTYDGGDYYSLIREVTVVKNSEDITVDIPKEIESGTNLTVVVNAPDIEWTFVQIKADDRDVDYVLVNDGVAIDNIANLTDGYHNINILYDNRVFDENGNLVGDLYWDEFTVNVGVKTNINASDVVCDYNSGENMTITLTDVNGSALADMEVTITIAGANHTITTNAEGQASWTVDIAGGEYVANVSFAGAEGYLSSYTLVNVTVNRIATNLKAIEVIMHYGDDRNLTVTLTDVDGNPLADKAVQIMLNGTNHTQFTNQNGQAFLPITLTDGFYMAFITFEGDEAYSNSSTSVFVEVKKYPTIFSIYSQSLCIYARNYVLTMELGLYITNCDFIVNYNYFVANKTIVYEVDGQNHTARTNEKGIVMISMDLLPGNHTLECYFQGDDRYYGTYTNETFSLSKMYTNLTADNVSMSYGDGDGLTVTLKDLDGCGFADKTISIDLNGTVYNRTTDENGNVKLAVDLASGNYTAFVSFAGDDYFRNASAVAYINISKADTRLAAPDVYTTYNKTGELTVTLTDAKGKALANKYVTVSFNGVDVSNATDNLGQIKVPIALPVGNYAAEIRFEGDENYSSSKQTAHITVDDRCVTTVEVSDVVTTRNSGDKLIVTLKDVFGNVLSGKDIVVNLNNVVFNEKTDLTGKVSIPIDLACGSYQADISFAGDINYKPSSSNVSVVVNKIPTALTSTNVNTVYNNAKNLVITLKDDKGNKLAQKTVIVKLNGRTYTKTTDANGQVKISVNLPAKTYTATISFNGDDDYLTSATTANVVVSKATPKLTAKSKTFKVKTKVKKYTVTLKDNKGRLMNKMKVTLKVKGKTYKATTKKGKATFKITKLTKKGTFKAVVKYAGNANYKKVSKTVKIKVKK